MFKFILTLQASIPRSLSPAVSMATRGKLSEHVKDCRNFHFGVFDFFFVIHIYFVFNLTLIH